MITCAKNCPSGHTDLKHKTTNTLNQSIMKYESSELIINADGTVFHLHIAPEQLADKVILVGDPARVDTVASFFDSVECNISSREFHTITGTYKDKRLTVISTGIGCDNCDIVINEIDALKNIDFNTRDDKTTFQQLEIVRIGTCGGLQPHTPIGTFICSEISIGFDGLLNFYDGRDNVCDLVMEQAFKEHMNWHPRLGSPYTIYNNKELLERIYQPEKGMVKGVTIACGGFYGPQGRRLRIPLADAEQNAKIESFEYQGKQITNFEMESSAIAGLSTLLGHKALTVCMVIANRRAKEANTGYRNQIEDLIKLVLERI
jgi:uridine phosphorylase